MNCSSWYKIIYESFGRPRRVWGGGVLREVVLLNDSREKIKRKKPYV